MLNIYHVAQENQLEYRLRNSIMCYLPPAKRNFKFRYFKNTNSIRGSYKDSILKDQIYITSSGFKTDILVRKQNLKRTTIASTTLDFTSFYKNLEYKHVNVNMYPDVYENAQLKLIFLKKFLLKTFLKKKLEQKLKSRIKTAIKYPLLWSDYCKWRELYSKIALINIGQHFRKRGKYYKLFFLTNKGFVTKIKKDFFDRFVYTGLVHILPSFIKRKIKKFLLMPFLLLKFYTNAFLTKKRNAKDLFYTVILYTFFYKYNVVSFFKYLKKKKLKIRKSNIFLRRYIYVFLVKINSVIYKMFNKVCLKLKNINDLQKNLLAWTFYTNSNNSIFFYSMLKERIQNLMLSEKLSMFGNVVYLSYVILMEKGFCKGSNEFVYYLQYKTLFIKRILEQSFATKNLYIKNWMINFWNYNIYSLITTQFKKTSNLLGNLECALDFNMKRKEFSLINDFIDKSAANSLLFKQCQTFWQKKTWKLQKFLRLKKKLLKNLSLEIKQGYLKYLKIVLLNKKYTKGDDSISKSTYRERIKVLRREKTHYVKTLRLKRIKLKITKGQKLTFEQFKVMYSDKLKLKQVKVRIRKLKKFAKLRKQIWKMRKKLGLKRFNQSKSGLKLDRIKHKSWIPAYVKAKEYQKKKFLKKFKQSLNRKRSFIKINTIKKN